MAARREQLPKFIMRLNELKSQPGAVARAEAEVDAMIQSVAEERYERGLRYRPYSLSKAIRAASSGGTAGARRRPSAMISIRRAALACEAHEAMAQALSSTGSSQGSQSATQVHYVGYYDDYLRFLTMTSSTLRRCQTWASRCATVPPRLSELLRVVWDLAARIRRMSAMRT